MYNEELKPSVAQETTSADSLPANEAYESATDILAEILLKIALSGKIEGIQNQESIDCEQDNLKEAC